MLETDRLLRFKCILLLKRKIKNQNSIENNAQPMDIFILFESLVLEELMVLEEACLRRTHVPKETYVLEELIVLEKTHVLEETYVPASKEA